MRHWTTGLLALAFVMSLVGCASSSGALRLPVSLVHSSRDTISAAVLRGDAQTVAAYFAADAVVLPPDALEIRGREAIRTLFFTVFQQARVSHYVLTPDTVIVAGTSAVDMGTYVETFAPFQGPPAHLKGRYVFLWQKGADGTWRAKRLIYNHGPS